MKYELKYIVKDDTSCNAFIISNGYSHSLKTFISLINEAKKSFPDLSNDDVECRTVLKSGWCQYRSLIRFPCDPKAQILEGWTYVEKLPDIVVL